MRLINDSTGEYLEILPDLGAGINDLVLKNKEGRLLSVIDGYRSENEILSDHQKKFKGSKLSPFPNRIPNGRYHFKGKNFQLPINEVGANNNIHALLHDQPFEIKSRSAEKGKAVLALNHHYEGVHNGYPFVYSLSVTYEFNGTSVKISTDITNLSNEEIPMGDGWHPYFHFEDIDNVEMKMGPATRLTSNVGNQPSDVHGFEDGKLCTNIALDDCFKVQQGTRHSFQFINPDRALDLEVWQESSHGKYEYFQVYTPPHRQSIAIEPVTCAPNAFNTGEGLIILKPNEKVSMSFGIENIELNN